MRGAAQPSRGSTGEGFNAVESQQTNLPAKNKGDGIYSFIVEKKIHTSTLQSSTGPEPIYFQEAGPASSVIF